MTIEEKAKEYCPDDAYPFGPNIINKEVRKAFIAGWKAKEESEKPVPKDLEEAAKKYATEWHENPDGSAWKPYFEVSAIKAFISGAKWQKEQTEKRWLEDRDGCFWDGVEEGKKAMKEQMLKEAVAEVEVGMRGDPIEIILDKYVQRAMGIFPRDKVRIIILKED